MSGIRAGPPARPGARFGFLVAIALVAIAQAGILVAGGQNLLVPAPSSTPTATPAESQPPAAFVCPADANPDTPGPIDQARPPAGFWGPVVFDAQSGRLIAAEAQRRIVWTFDVCANRWDRSGTTLPEEPQAMAYDPAADRTLIFGDRVMTYDADSDALTVRGRGPVAGRRHAVYRGETGLVVVRDDDQSKLWTYDATSDTWRSQEQHGDVSPGSGTGATLLAYDESVDRLVLYVRTSSDASLYEFELDTATWTLREDPVPALNLVWGDLGIGEIAYDKAHTRSVLFSDGQVIAYDATSHRWEFPFNVGIGAFDRTSRMGVWLAYESVNERIVALGGNRRTGGEPIVTDDVLAFDLDDDSWTVLVPQSSP
jgi:hypothetical protein